ncbi:viroplasmin family protein [Vibrio owensii]|uniref:ribonuclease H1 domain-containing protein n=1 Tax=Vibrio harveyi group TaxID=717610 RepID=UPI003CC501FE
MANKKYVVWVGRKPGVYNTWSEAEKQVKGFSGAKYKSFAASKAKEAFEAGPDYDPSSPTSTKKKSFAVPATKFGIPKFECLTVDAAYGSKSTIMEWRGVMNISKKEVFRSRPYVGGSNNIGEFLALIDGIQFLRESGQTNFHIYSDSQTALAWIRSGVCNTTISPTVLEQEIIDRIKHAEQYLKSNPVTEIQLRKWDTPKWGVEIPADFGRK